MTPSDWTWIAADDPAVVDCHKCRDARRAQRARSPLDVNRVRAPAVCENQRDEAVEVGVCERLDRELGHVTSGASAKAIAFPFGSGIWTWRTPLE